MEMISNEIVLITLTFGIYYLARQFQKWTGWTVLNPILVTIVLLILFLKLTGISYESYQKGGSYIEFWLKPSIVALGVPLYRHLSQIKKQFLPIFLSQLAGCLTGIISVVLIAKWMGAPREIIVSLAPKSVTTPIAMEISRATGGIPSLTAAIVVTVGIFGAVLGFKILEVWHVKNPYSQGLSMGAASHAVGTSRAMEKGELWGTYASLGLILNGVLTALFAPLVLKMLGI
ncbi:MAG: LrgB family protein [Bacteroidales bacterium]|nr:LrgB family protein [Bacteroidales bacterium]